MCKRLATRRGGFRLPGAGGGTARIWRGSLTTIFGRRGENALRRRNVRHGGWPFLQPSGATAKHGGWRRTTTGGGGGGGSLPATIVALPAVAAKWLAWRRRLSYAVGGWLLTAAGYALISGGVLALLGGYSYSGGVFRLTTKLLAAHEIPAAAAGLGLYWRRLRRTGWQPAVATVIPSGLAGYRRGLAQLLQWQLLFASHQPAGSYYITWLKIWLAISMKWPLYLWPLFYHAAQPSIMKIFAARLNENGPQCQCGRKALYFEIS